MDGYGLGCFGCKSGSVKAAHTDDSGRLPVPFATIASFTGVGHELRLKRDHKVSAEVE